VHSRKKLLLGSSCPSVCPHVSARFPLGEFACSLLMGTVMNVCLENPTLFKNRELYKKVFIHFLAAGDIQTAIKALFSSRMVLDC